MILKLLDGVRTNGGWREERESPNGLCDDCQIGVDQISRAASNDASPPAPKAPTATSHPVGQIGSLRGPTLLPL